MLSSGLVFCFVAVGKKMMKHRKHSVAVAMLSAAFALLWLLSISVDQTGSFAAIANTPAQIIKSVVYLFGMGYFLFLCGQILYYYCTKRIVDVEDKRNNHFPLTKWYCQHAFFCNMTLLFLAWIPYLILDYPARIAWDSWREMSMFFGYTPFTAHDPPAHTVLISMFVLLGKAMGDANIGLCIFAIVQMITLSALIAYEIELMKQLDAQKGIRVATMLAAMLSTPYSFYSVEVLKDCQYVHCFLLMILEFLCLLKMGRKFFDSKLHMLLMCFAICGVMLFRKNGKYIIYFMIAAALIWLVVKLIKSGIGYIKTVGIRPAIILLLPVVLAESINISLVRYYDIGEASIREVLSLPLQQTSRYVISHPEDVTEEEADTIRALIDFDRIPEIYQPTITDPVKGTFKEDVTMEELFSYFKTWAKHLLRHPMTYVKATVHQTYPLYYPFKESIRARYAVRFIPEFANVINEVGYLTDPVIRDGNEMTQHWGVMSYRLPVVGLLSSQAFYVVLIAYLVMFGILDRHSKFIWLVSPLVLSILVVFASPVMLNHERYAFPFIYSTPIVVAFFCHSYMNNTRKS